MDKYKAKELNQIAKVDLNKHAQGAEYNSPFKCRACGLKFSYDNGPIAEKWALTYVCAEVPIKEEWRNAFIDELTHPDVTYREQLEESVRYFGVRWA